MIHLCVVSAATPVTSANTADHCQANDVDTWFIAVDQFCGCIASANGWPDTSDKYIGTINKAMRPKHNAATAPVFDATVPSALSMAKRRAGWVFELSWLLSVFWLLWLLRGVVGVRGVVARGMVGVRSSRGEHRKPANKNDPTDNAANIHAAARKNGNPAVVNGPGSGIPNAANDSPKKPADTTAPTTPAVTQNNTNNGQVTRALLDDAAARSVFAGVEVAPTEFDVGVAEEDDVMH